MNVKIASFATDTHGTVSQNWDIDKIKTDIDCPKVLLQKGMDGKINKYSDEKSEEKFILPKVPDCGTISMH